MFLTGVAKDKGTEDNIGIGTWNVRVVIPATGVMGDHNLIVYPFVLPVDKLKKATQSIKIRWRGETPTLLLKIFLKKLVIWKQFIL